MKTLFLLTSFLLLINNIFAAGPSTDCSELKKSIQRTEYGIKSGEDMIKGDPTMNTPDFQKALSDMKKSLAAKKAELKAAGCGSNTETGDFIDFTKDQKFATPCEKAKAEIKATKDYIVTETALLKTATDPMDIKRNKEANAQAIKHLHFQEAYLKNNNCR